MFFYQMVIYSYVHSFMKCFRFLVFKGVTVSEQGFRGIITLLYRQHTNDAWLICSMVGGLMLGS